MSNLVEFLRMFFSYIVCFLTFGVVAFLGGFIGVKCWKNKDKKDA